MAGKLDGWCFNEYTVCDNKKIRKTHGKRVGNFTI